MPSQIFVILGVEDDQAEICYNEWQITDSFVLLHCATTVTPGSPKPTLLTCLHENTLRAFSEAPKIIIGDPSCERLHLSYPENIDVVTSISSHLKTKALISIGTGAAAIGEGEALTIILCGHGDIEGKFLIGSGDGVCRQLVKEEIEASVQSCKGQITVITTACHGGLWTSELWDLVAAAPASEESNSIVASESGQYRGGIFTSALLTEHYSQAGVAMPRPGVATISEACGSHKTNESCISCRLNAPLSNPEPQNTDALISEMNKFRVSLNRALYEASFGHHGNQDSVFPFHGPTLLSIAPFTKIKLSPMTSTSVGQSGIQNTQIATPQHHVDIDIEGPEDAPWTLMEEQEMRNLAIAVEQEVLATVPSNLFIMRSALWYLTGGEKRRTVQSIKNKKPLTALRKHEALRTQARIIASMMGWDTSIDPAMTESVDATLIQEACDIGKCDVNVVAFEGKWWREPAYWLARLWKAAGGIAVDRSIWDKAVSSAQQQS